MPTSLIFHPEREPGPASAEDPGLPNRIVFTLHSGCRITGPTDGAPDGALNGAPSKVPNGTARGPLLVGFTISRLQNRNCCSDQNHDNSHGLQSHLLHGRKNTTRKRGIYQQGSAGQLFSFFTVELVASTQDCRHHDPPEPSGGERNLMQEKTRRTDKILKLWQIGPVPHFCRRSGDDTRT